MSIQIMSQKKDGRFKQIYDSAIEYANAVKDETGIPVQKTYLNLLELGLNSVKEQNNA